MAIADALVMRPSTDPGRRTDRQPRHTWVSAEIMLLFRRLNDEGITIVFVTHEPDVAAYARRIIIVRDG
ncbi:MAG: hypothetical protein U0531_00820 [Dehalococcoidia bacterium]